MTMFGKASAAMLVTAVVAIEAGAQAPAPPQPQPAQSKATAAKAPASMQPYRRRSIVHHYPHPYPEMYHGDQRAGFRNPGGTGRYLEYYPAGDRFQANVERGFDPVKPAQFGGGGIPDRNEQLAAQQLGVAKYNAIQGHIDNMARPAFGYGFFGGFY